MSIQFTAIAGSFTREELKLPNLNVLTPDGQSYEVLAIQPSGAIDARDDFVGHADRELACGKFKGFIDLAVEKNADLVLCPEYSCPWKVLKDALQNEIFPSERKLWVFGCESITPQEFREFVVSFPNIKWIHEDLPNSTRDFFGVVCYLLKTRSNNGDIKKVIVVQFKTFPMAGNDTSESDHLICGQTIYSLRNQVDYARFVTIICSEALQFQLDNVNNISALEFNQHPHIIFHPQLSANPRHAGVRRYRFDLFHNYCSRELEIFTLNWARGFRIGMHNPSCYGGSGIFMKSDRFIRSDDRVHHNHQKGIYYCKWIENQTELCIFNFNEHIFNFRTYKNALIGPAVELRRHGPEMRTIWQWDDDNHAWLESENANDGFRELCDRYENPALTTSLDGGFNVVDRERLLTLSAGKLEPCLDWHRIEKLNSFIAESDERSKRLTFVHEQHTDSVEFRNEHLSRFNTLLNVILPNPALFPENIVDLAGNWGLQPPQASNEFRYNLVYKSRKVHGATVVFVGQRPLSDARKLRDKFVEAWKNRNNERGEEKTFRLVVWYQDVAGNILHVPQSSPTIFGDSELPTSIKR